VEVARNLADHAYRVEEAVRRLVPRIGTRLKLPLKAFIHRLGIGIRFSIFLHDGRCVGRSFLEV
jgi:hypothetical protein